MHRGFFDWELAEKRKSPDSVQGKIFSGLQKLVSIRKEREVFAAKADVRTIDTWDNSALGIIRETECEKLVELYNFSGHGVIAWINETDGIYTDMISGNKMEAKAVDVPPFGFYWLLRQKL